MMVLLSFSEFVKENMVWLIAVVAAVVILLVFGLIFILRRNKKGPEKPVLNVVKSEWLEAFGGKDNLLECSAKGSRLTIKLKDKSLLNKETIKQLGVENIMEMSGKIILVVEDNAEHIMNELNKN